MKTITMLLITTLMVTASFAKNSQTTSMSSTKKNTIAYPTEALEKQIQGVVYIEFMKNTDNKIEVLSCFSLEGELQSYVFTNFGKMNIIPEELLPNKKYAMRFDFILVE